MLSDKLLFYIVYIPTAIFVVYLCGYFWSGLIRRIREYLLFLQQDEYSPTRFFLWYIKNKAYDKKVTFITLIFCILMAIGLFLNTKCGFKFLIDNNRLDAFYTIYVIVIVFLYMLIVGFVLKKEQDPETNAKLQLKLTKRAVRIELLTQIVLMFPIVIILISTMCVSLDNHSNISVYSIFLLFSLAVIFQLIPFVLMLVVLILSPIEKLVRNRYLKEANEKFSSVNPYTIAVVGSYGKSTVKNMLGEILSGIKGHTFWPKAGINTLMGITRKIREELKESDKYAVIEMGTYKKGSITQTCSLTPPNAAILTAINHMHLERFKTRENIYEAKTEVIKALPQDGILVCNADDDFVLRAYKEASVKNKFLYGLNSKNDISLDAYITNINYTADGTTAKIYYKNTEYDLKTKVVGRGGISSLLASFTMACALGLDPKLVIAMISQIEPLKNRLVLKKYPNNLIYLEDGYNSNPLGFDSALEVLEKLDVKRRIVMTPGIIELGTEQGDVNYKIGKKIASICDVVIFVGSENKEFYKKAFDETSFANVHYVQNRDEGFKILTDIQQEGDAVLIENDLPDWYEAKVSF